MCKDSGTQPSCRPCKWVKSAPIVDSDDEDTAKPICRGVTKTYDLHNPPPNFPILPAMDRCDHCAHRMLPCARKEDRACFQCNKGKHGCSLSLKCMRSQSQLCAPAAQTSQPDPPPPITSTNPCTTAYKPSLFDLQMQSQESHSHGCCICRSSTCSWTFNTWPIKGQM